MDLLTEPITEEINNLNEIIGTNEVTEASDYEKMDKIIDSIRIGTPDDLERLMPQIEIHKNDIKNYYIREKIAIEKELVRLDKLLELTIGYTKSLRNNIDIKFINDRDSDSEPDDYYDNTMLTLNMKFKFSKHYPAVTWFCGRFYYMEYSLRSKIFDIPIHLLRNFIANLIGCQSHPWAFKYIQQRLICLLNFKYVYTRQIFEMLDNDELRLSASRYPICGVTTYDNIDDAYDSIVKKLRSAFEDICNHPYSKDDPASIERIVIFHDRLDIMIKRHLLNLV